MLTRLTTIAETKAGPEIAMTALNWPHLFDKSLVDVSDIAGEIGKQLGGWHENVLEVLVVNKKWKALPWGNIGQLEVYRTDWFKEVGVNKFPETWEDLLAAGRLLKKKGHPFGFELGHGFGDNHGWLYPLFWSYGGREVDRDGKTVVIDSSETAKAVDFCRKFYQETMFEDVLGWTDVNNNKAFFGEQISCTNNASSILEVGLRQFPDIAKVTDHAMNPSGPKGRFHVLNAVSHAVLTHAPDQAAAKAFLRWLYDDKQMSRWLASANAYYAPFLHGYDNHPMWNVEPRYLPYKECLKTSRRSLLERESVFSWVMLAPGVLFLLAFVAYPFVYGIFISLQDRRVASPGSFVGLANFVAQAQDAVFWQVTRNTFIYTIVATFLKMTGGLAMALVINQQFRGKNLARALLLLPFIVPTVLSTVAWMWIFDPTFSVINWTLRHTGLVTENFSWLGNATLALVSIIIVNTWRGLPFYGITLLAGLQTISPDLYEAAAIDGASVTQRFRHITLPVLKPVLIIVTMFSVIFTFSDFQLPYVLTHGGPANATHLFATHAFDVGMSAGVLGKIGRAHV